MSARSNSSPAILLIENNTRTPRPISGMLTQSGCQVTLASDEAEAVTTTVQPTAIIFNLARPALELIDSGFRIRSALGLNQAPIIVVSWRRSGIIPLGNNVYVSNISDFSQLDELLIRLAIKK